MSRPLLRCVVVGAGPVGLAAADRLGVEGVKGVEVTVLHRDDPLTPTATSVGPGAGGLVEPVATEPGDAHLIAELFAASVPVWAGRADDPALGADLRHVRYHGEPGGPPEWVQHTLDPRQVGEDRWVYDSVVVTPQVFIAEQRSRLAARGVTFRQEHVRDLRDLTRRYDLVVNASGPGALALGDPEMYGRRGALVWARSNPAMEEARVDVPDHAYGIPQRTRVALGWTSDPVDGDPASWDRQITTEEVELLLQRASRLYEVPVRDIEVESTALAYRPCRTSLRIDAERCDGAVLVHALGLAGSGWTLSPGVAQEVVAQAVLAEPDLAELLGEPVPVDRTPEPSRA